MFHRYGVSTPTYMKFQHFELSFPLLLCEIYNLSLRKDFRSHLCIDTSVVVSKPEILLPQSLKLSVFHSLSLIIRCFYYCLLRRKSEWVGVFSRRIDFVVKSMFHRYGCLNKKRLGWLRVLGEYLPFTDRHDFDSCRTSRADESTFLEASSEIG